MAGLKEKNTQIIVGPTAAAPTLAPCAKTPAANSHLNQAFNAGVAGSAIEGAKVYGLDSNPSRLLIYDVSNPAAMSKIGDQTLNSGAFAVNQVLTSAIGVLNSKAYVANYDVFSNCYLAVYDCTVPGAITQAGFLLLAAGTNNGSPRKVALSVVGADTFAFVPFNDVINIIKVTNPAAMVSVATVTVPSTPGDTAQGVFVFNNVLYATGGGGVPGDNRVKAWNVATPSAPVLLWNTVITFDDPNVISLPAVYVANQLASPVAAVLIQDLNHGALQLVNATTGALLGTLVYSIGAITVSGSLWIDPTGVCLLATVEGSNRLHLTDIANPSAPVAKPDVTLNNSPISISGLSTGTPANVFLVGDFGTNPGIESVNV